MVEKDFMDASFQGVLTRNNVSFCVMKNLFYILILLILSGISFSVSHTTFLKFYLLYIIIMSRTSFTLKFA